MRGCFAMVNLESRVTDLEIQISYQIKMLEELNSVMIYQQKKLEKIEQKNEFVIQSLKSFNSSENDPF